MVVTDWSVPLKDSFQQLCWTLMALAPAAESFFFPPAVLPLSIVYQIEHKEYWLHS